MRILPGQELIITSGREVILQHSLAGDEACGLQVGKVEVTYLDVSGTYVTKNPPFDPKAKEERHPDYRMLSVYFASENGPYFLRMTGPAKTVEQNKKGFDEWVKNFK